MYCEGYQRLNRKLELCFQLYGSSDLIYVRRDQQDRQEHQENVEQRYVATHGCINVVYLMKTY